jgi:hypothetical protein
MRSPKHLSLAIPAIAWRTNEKSPRESCHVSTPEAFLFNSLLTYELKILSKPQEDNTQVTLFQSVLVLLKLLLE